jgi:DNA-binding transcriptional LysR family regulator
MQRRHDFLNIPIEVLRSFVAIQESGSFTKAADLLRLTQPAISAQVKRLQQLVGGDVFTRTGFGVSLTEKGEIVSRYARRILAMNDQILSLSGTSANTRTFRIGIPNIYAATMLQDVIAASRGILDEDKVQFTCEPSFELARNLASGYLDIALIASLTVPSGQAVARWPEASGWVCARDFVLSPGAPIPILSWPNGVSDHSVIDVIESVGLQYSIVFVAADYSAQLAALRAGLGFYCLPERFVPDDLKVARDHYLPPLPPYDAGIYIREGLESEKALALAEAIAEVTRPSPREKKAAASELRRRRA